VIVAGGGGGFDVYAGLPIALGLRALGKEVHLANLTFSWLGDCASEWVAPNVAAVTARTRGSDEYFPERTLARWLATRGMEQPVYAFEKTGVRPLRAAWRALCTSLRVDAIVLVDGGTDVLMRGDESGLGTPEEDLTSLAAIDGLDEVPTRLLACIGFGIDTFHGVCHAHFLENVAALAREGGYHGCFSVPRESPEGEAFLDAVDDAQRSTPRRPSIVNGSIAAALRGRFGDVQFTRRTDGSELFISPLMSLYWAFDLRAVAARCLYRAALEETNDIWDVSTVIRAFRAGVVPRPERPIPH
jgi:hypothetical protein